MTIPPSKEDSVTRRQRSCRARKGRPRGRERKRKWATAPFPASTRIGRVEAATARRPGAASVRAAARGEEEEVDAERWRRAGAGVGVDRGAVIEAFQGSFGTQD